MDITWMREVVLVLAFTVFGGIVWWAYAPSRRARFERDGHSVFDDERADGAMRSVATRSDRSRSGV